MNIENGFCSPPDLTFWVLALQACANLYIGEHEICLVESRELSLSASMLVVKSLRHHLSSGLLIFQSWVLSGPVLYWKAKGPWQPTMSGIVFKDILV